VKVGVLGGGQLGWMLALAGEPIGLHFRFWDPAADCIASRVGEHVRAPFDDAQALERFVHGVDVVTYEFENVPVATVKALAERVTVWPPAKALETAQDRLNEKRFFEAHDVALPPWRAVESRAELAEAIAAIGLPAVLKTRRLGYDGKGQAALRSASDADAAWRAVGGKPCVLEAFVPFDCEASCISVRGRDGEIRHWPLCRNVHVGGILHRTESPAPEVDALVGDQARRNGERILEALNYVGVLTVEYFVAGGRLLANEMAPRVHNSGHWTMHGAATCQFENHVRAVAGLPIGPTNATGFAAMLNLVGETPATNDVLQLRNTWLHLYGKEPRPARKLGHVTVVGANEAERAELLASATPFGRHILES